MEYLIYCKFTNKLLAVYKSKETLKTLDHSKCFYVEKLSQQEREKRSEFKRNFRESVNPRSLIIPNNDYSNDFMNPLNPISPISPLNPINQIYSEQNHTHSYSSSDSSSSSCDSGSW